GIPDDRDLLDGTVTDVNNNGIPDVCEGLAGVAFCVPGQNGVIACVCGNPNGPNVGCGNTGSTGASLAAAGSPTVGADTLPLTGASLFNGTSCIYLQGNLLIPTGAVFGAGIRCTGGSLKRLYIKFITGGATSAPAAGDPTISAQSAVLGDTLAGGQT